MMKGLQNRVFSALCALGVVIAARAEAPLRFEEIFSLVRSNLTELSEADLNKAATIGLIEKLGGKAEIVDQASMTNSQVVVAKTNVFDGAFAYVRLNRVGPGAGEQVAAAISAGKKLKGVVLDLRFAKGDDYKAAAEVANIFIDAAEPILKWGDQSAATKANATAIKLPLAVLVNRQTAGAAEALAGALANAERALLVGNRTAGQAVSFADFPLSNGQHLRIAKSRVELANGKAIGTEGLTPDLLVEVDERNERSWLDDPYRTISRPGLPAGPQPFLTSITNRMNRRMNGAEVGRRHREEIEQDENPGAPARSDNSRAAAPAVDDHVIQDPALVRAIDFLKGVSAMRSREAVAK